MKSLVIVGISLFSILGCRTMFDKINKDSTKLATPPLSPAKNECNLDGPIVDFTNGEDFQPQNGMKVKMEGTKGLFNYTRLCLFGNQANITRVFVAVHGDGNPDYSDNLTQDDRDDLLKYFPKDQGLILAFPIATHTEWNDFSNLEKIRKNYDVFTKMFNHFKRVAKNPSVGIEVFSLSGGDLVNWAFYRLIRDKYDNDPQVRELVDNNIRGIHDGDACGCRASFDDVKETYVQVLQRFPQIKGTFVHRRAGGGTSADIYSHHKEIAKVLYPSLKDEDFTRSADYGEKGSLRLENGRLRFWSGSSHGHSWFGQFARVFLDIDPAAAPPVQDDFLNKENENLKTEYQESGDRFTAILKNPDLAGFIEQHMLEKTITLAKDNQSLQFSCFVDDNTNQPKCQLVIERLGEKTAPLKWQVDKSGQFFVIRNDTDYSDVIKPFYLNFQNYQENQVTKDYDEHVGIKLPTNQFTQFSLPEGEDNIWQVVCMKNLNKDKDYFCKILIKIP